jgi:DNA primase small subunit
LIAAIQKRQPHKIDIGAVFTGCPKDHNTIKPELFTTKERELVFDIDMTDYDDIRTCCTGANICHRCWPYMTMAIKVVDRALRDDFGFRHILWIYSGRRGVHCWVCDPAARELSNEARTAVVDYLTIHTGSSENSDKKLKQSFENPHPMVRRAYNILDPYFAECIADEAGQGLLARKDRYMKVLNSLPNEAIRRELYEKWEGNNNLTGKQRWQQVKAATTAPADVSAHQTLQNKKRKISYTELESWRYELVFTHCYARLDANVSKTQNHLLKSAFCVHPKTGRVCVPIDPADADNFDPFTVPTVRSLCAEVRRFILTRAGNCVARGGGDSLCTHRCAITFLRVLFLL